MGIADSRWPLQKSRVENKGSGFPGTTPTLIPSEFTPGPYWGEVHTGTSWDGESVLGTELAACPAVVDERIRTAIDLAIASRHDSLPRSIFLSHLTILDSLAIRSYRAANVSAWLEEKITEAGAFKDDGLLSSLEELKQRSHGSAVPGLVKRAAQASGEEVDAVKSRGKLANELYRVRSRLSHSGSTFPPESGNQARDLALFVLEAAIQYPHILDPERE
jgi:hypothetical protein